MFKGKPWQDNIVRIIFRPAVDTFRKGQGWAKSLRLVLSTSIIVGSLLLITFSHTGTAHAAIPHPVVAQQAQVNTSETFICVFGDVTGQVIGDHNNITITINDSPDFNCNPMVIGNHNNVTVNGIGNVTVIGDNNNVTGNFLTVIGHDNNVNGFGNLVITP